MSGAIGEIPDKIGKLGNPLRWRIGASGIEGLILEAEGGDREVVPGEVASVPVRLDAPREAIRNASTPVRFTIEAVGAGDIRATEEARFLGPEASAPADADVRARVPGLAGGLVPASRATLAVPMQWAARIPTYEAA